MVGLFSVYTPLPSPSWIGLKEPAIAGHIYNPPPNPSFKCASLLFVAAVRQNKHVCSALTLIATLIRRGLLLPWGNPAVAGGDS